MAKGDIADAMRSRREELGMTVVDAVDKTGISRSTWKDLEATRRNGLSAPTGTKLDGFFEWPRGTSAQLFREGEAAPLQPRRSDMTEDLGQRVAHMEGRFIEQDRRGGRIGAQLEEILERLNAIDLKLGKLTHQHDD